MNVALGIDDVHIEEAVKIIIAARKTGKNEKAAVEDYCVAQELFCLPDLFCLAIGM